MKAFKIIIVLVSLTLVSNSCTSQEEKELAVMAYYVPSNNYPLENIPFEKLTHIIFSFTEVIDNQMKFKNESSSQKLKDLVTYKKQYPHLKVMIACGGWGGCAGFSDMANDPELRQKFVKSTMDFIKEYDLDGTDMDWEYPGMRGAGNTFRKEDTQNFTALMKELREGLDATGKDMTLTFASAGWERYYDHIETLEVMKYADYMNVMTYDLAGGSSPFTAHHTNLGAFSFDDIKGTPAHEFVTKSKRKGNPRSAESIVDFCKGLGVKPEQIIIGGAFYGRGWKGVGPENNGLYQKNNGVWVGWAQYANIRNKHEGKGGFVEYWDPIAKAPYLYNATDSLFISYDNPKSVQLKTKYVKNNGLGGIMFWQLTDDAQQNGLLDAIHEEVIKD
ncbi:glycoside hydrolase family 18 protein [Tamlana sp. 2201CG12-4]|uniref:glycoside hydrolase family 18 protein n=1 Tax=Tamlana sp. 2201CG12-4 TaxID=3112582 RepID=UPI002DC01A55|nr:glycoside hydrolase family 18 protein [Tamlana sp. 2201CG12-4]MEC3907142.1 glycoside hydrolase family 18 protein [Tamlana sp. 2201CG12-4]